MHKTQKHQHAIEFIFFFACDRKCDVMYQIRVTFFQ